MPQPHQSHINHTDRPPTPVSKKTISWKAVSTFHGFKNTIHTCTIISFVPDIYIITYQLKLLK